MRIAVLGSSKSKNSSIGRPIANPAGAEQFCREFGFNLAEFPHSLLVASDNIRTADRSVVEGLLAAPSPRQARVRVYQHDSSGAGPFAAEAERAPDLFQPVPLPAGPVGPAHLRMLQRADVAIIVGGGDHAYAAGLAAAFMGVRVIPVAGFGGAGRLLWEELEDQFTRPLVKLPKRETWDRLAGADVLKAILAEIASLPQLMVVHGRSHDREQLVEILKAYGVSEPVVLAERFDSAQTVPEKFELEATRTDGAIALFTPDDEAASLLDRTGKSTSARETDRQLRARQNVNVEVGWFWGKLGRDRLLLLVKGELELPSDLSGVIYASYMTSPKETVRKIHDFVDAVRFGRV